MFYVPEGLLFSKEKRSLFSLDHLNHLHNFRQNFKVQHKTIDLLKSPSNQSQKKRLKTVEQNWNTSRKHNNSLTCKRNYLLPLIQEKRFLLKGRVAGLFEEKKITTKKYSSEAKSGRVWRRDPPKKKEKLKQETTLDFIVQGWENILADND